MSDDQSMQYMIGVGAIVMGLTMVVSLWLLGRKSEPKKPEPDPNDSWIDDGSWTESYSRK